MKAAGLEYLNKEFWIYVDIINVGFPSLCRQGLASLATIFLNNQAGDYGGDAALSAMTIASKMFMIVFSASLGIGQGYQPVCGYNYFAKRYDRVKESMTFTLICGTVCMFLTCLFIFIFAKPLMEAFISNSPEVVKIGTRVIRYQCLSMPFMSLNVIANMSFQSTKKKLQATILSSCRQGLFFIPLVFLLPSMIGLSGVELTQALADFCTFLFTIPFFVVFVKELNKKAKEQQKLNEKDEFSLEF